MLLRARIVLPISAPPIEMGPSCFPKIVSRPSAHGAILLRAVANRPSIWAPVILLPGLVNAHCHLDYTDMTGLPPQNQFPDWIKGLLALKAAASYADYAEAWTARRKNAGTHRLCHGGRYRSRPGITARSLVFHVVARLSFLEMTGVKAAVNQRKSCGGRRQNQKSGRGPRARRPFTARALFNDAGPAAANSRPGATPPMARHHAPGRIAGRV